MGIYFYKQVFYIKNSGGDPKVTLALWEMNKKMQFKACVTQKYTF